MRPNDVQLMEVEMRYIAFEELSEALQKKIEDVAKARSHCVRRLSVEEADQIRQMAGWQHGWFLAPDNAQIVMQTRPNDQDILFRI